MPSKGPLTFVAGSFIMDAYTTMSMNLKILQLVDGTHIIADVEQLEEEPSCYLKNCYLIDEETNTLVEWPRYSSEREALIFSDRILTISDPHSDIVKKLPS